MEKATSNSLCVFCSGFLLLPQSQQHSYSEFVTADASLAPVNSDVALLCEPSQAWFIIPEHRLDTAHSCLNAFSSWDASFLPSFLSSPPPIPPSSYPRVPATSSFPFIFSRTWPDDFEVLRHLGFSGLCPTCSSQTSDPISTLLWTVPTSLLCVTSA